MANIIGFHLKLFSFYFTMIAISKNNTHYFSRTTTLQNAVFTRKVSYCIHFIHASQFLRSVYIIISDTAFFVVLIWPSCGFSLIYTSVNNRYVVATILEQKELLFRIFWRTKSDKSTIACIQGKVDDNFKAY